MRRLVRLMLADRRAVLAACLVFYLLVGLPATAIGADPLEDIDPAGTGSDLWSNIAPADLGGIADRYSPNAWRLDYHVPIKTGLTDFDVSGLPSLALHAIANIVWIVHVSIVKLVLTLFAWAFGTNLLDPRYGVLSPIAEVTTDIYELLGPWVSVAVIALGIALTHRLFVRRDVGGTVGQLAVTLVLSASALLLVNNPEWTAQTASGVARETSSGLLTATNGQTPGQSGDPRVRATDSLWKTLVADPWTVLQFGGTEHCVNAENEPVRPSSRECAKRIDHREKYVEPFLKAGASNNGTRTALYLALAKGEKPKPDEIEDLNADPEQVEAFRVDEADKPAADLMGQSGGEDRAAVTPIILLGGLGAAVMVGGMAALQIVMQVYFLLLLSLAGVMALLSLVPGRPQAVFKGWGARLIGALFRQVVVALLLGTAVAVSVALTNAGADLGWLFTFTAQAVFWWALFFYRKDLTAMLGSAAPEQARLSGERGPGVGQRLTSAYYTGKVASNVAGGVASVAGRVAGPIAHKGAEALGRDLGAGRHAGDVLRGRTGAYRDGEPTTPPAGGESAGTPEGNGAGGQVPVDPSATRNGPEPPAPAPREPRTGEPPRAPDIDQGAFVAGGQGPPPAPNSTNGQAPPTSSSPNGDRDGGAGPTGEAPPTPGSRPEEPDIGEQVARDRALMQRMKAQEARRSSSEQPRPPEPGGRPPTGSTPPPDRPAPRPPRPEDLDR